MKKLMILESMGYITDTFETDSWDSVDEVLERLQALRKKYPDDKLSICWAQEKWENDYFITTYGEIFRGRLETDKEFEKRTAKERKAKQKAKEMLEIFHQRQEENERREFERLKAKFEEQK